MEEYSTTPILQFLYTLFNRPTVTPSAITTSIPKSNNVFKWSESENAVLYSYLYFSFTRICYRIRAVFPSELNLFPYSQNDESMLRVRQLDLLPKWCKQCSFKVFST